MNETIAAQPTASYPTPGQMAELNKLLAVAVTRGNVSREDVQHLIENGGNLLPEIIASLHKVAPVIPVIQGKYNLREFVRFLSCNTRYSLADRLANLGIESQGDPNPELFIDPPLALSSMYYLLTFRAQVSAVRVIGFEETPSLLEEHGFVPATLRETLYFLASPPVLQRQKFRLQNCRLWALGSPVKELSLIVPCIEEKREGKIIQPAGLVQWEGERMFLPNEDFVLVRKSEC